MKFNVAPGRILVEHEEVSSDFIMPEKVESGQPAKVIAVGPPHPEVSGQLGLLLWHLFGIHPGFAKPGDIVYVPKSAGRTVSYEGKDRQVFWEYEILGKK